MFFRGLLIIAAIFISTLSFSQICQSGGIGVSGAGCGCLSGCDLTALGGPNCSPSVGGNCNGGYLTMSVSIVVPATCQVQISAQMQPRTGCSASGADGNSTSADRLRVRDTGAGTPAWQIGGSNSSLSDALTVTGPTTVVVEGAANRADEIITYTVTNTGSCSCSTILPITLTSFSGFGINDNTNVLLWTTSSEINNDYFVIERSDDAMNYKPIGTVDGAGNSNTLIDYDFTDDNAIFGSNYYRLKQIDFDGKFSYSNVIFIGNDVAENIYFNSQTNELVTNHLTNGTIYIYNMQGQIVSKIQANGENVSINQPNGIYLVSVVIGNQVYSIKVLVN